MAEEKGQWMMKDMSKVFVYLIPVFVAGYQLMLVVSYAEVKGFILDRRIKGQPGVLDDNNNNNNISHHSMKARLQTHKFRMIQKILNKFIGAKYVSILRAWAPNMGSSTRKNKVSHISKMTRAWELSYGWIAQRKLN
ncbi:hypothetical protein JOB18_035222 [Solea senegalensis]|uniref:Uncharacterized protein n=1 Tax=Solea senegalensis TaxID=28829 RepID=A0AAV6SB69_SOLSE|nr:hypothetical protein JOB18_035222 [Solea senegalensis]